MINLLNKETEKPQIQLETKLKNKYIKTKTITYVD
jgi:hypothetical protein